MTVLSPFIAILVALSTVFTSVFCYARPIDKRNYKVYDNVILFIGDGMGENHIEAAKDKLNIDIVMEDFAVRGNSKTDNYWGNTTDSAAGGTALATGMKTENGYVGRSIVDPDGNITEPMNLTELAISMGKAAGVVTTDKTTGATPAAFSAHASDRDYIEEISDDQLASDLTLIWGAKEDYVTEEMAAESGFEYIETLAGIEALPEGTRSFGQFCMDDLAEVKNTDSTPSLAKMTEEAINILDNDEDGFFLMVEAAHIDKFSHGKDIDNAARQVEELNKAVEYALEYAENNGDTLIVVTADHETGSVTYDESMGGYYCTTEDHSSADVPLFVSDAEAGFKNGEAVKNSRIPAQIALCMGAEKGAFPACNGTLSRNENFKL